MHMLGTEQKIYKTYKFIPNPMNTTPWTLRTGSKLEPDFKTKPACLEKSFMIVSINWKDKTSK